MAMLERITPVVLTYNEALNVGRTLEQLRWAKEVIVVDSCSTDETVSIVERFPNARVFENPFESHSDQWRFALDKAGAGAEWILRLDADYVLTPELIDELATLAPDGDVGGYRIGFVYCIYGRPLRATLYPPNVVLFRRDRARVYQGGHNERIAVTGRIVALKHRIRHDDRKPLGRWIRAQDIYMGLEAEMLRHAAAGRLNVPIRIRRKGYLTPALVFLHALFVKGLILDGLPGVFYAFQRTTAEFILSLHVMDRKLRGRED